VHRSYLNLTQHIGSVKTLRASALHQKEAKRSPFLTVSLSRKSKPKGKKPEEKVRKEQ